MKAELQCTRFEPSRQEELL